MKTVLSCLFIYADVFSNPSGWYHFLIVFLCTCERLTLLMIFQLLKKHLLIVEEHHRIINLLHWSLYLPYLQDTLMFMSMLLFILNLFHCFMYLGSSLMRREHRFIALLRRHSLICLIYLIGLSRLSTRHWM